MQPIEPQEHVVSPLPISHRINAIDGEPIDAGLHLETKNAHTPIGHSRYNQAALAR